MAAMLFLQRHHKNSSNRGHGRSHSVCARRSSTASRTIAALPGDLRGVLPQG